MTIRPLFAALALLAWACGPLAAAPAAADSSRLISLEPVLHTAELEFLIRVEGAFEHTYVELSDPVGLAIDITPCYEVTAPAVLAVGAFGVEKVRTSQPRPGTARVLFEFGKRRPYYLLNRTPEGIHIVFLSGASGRSAQELRPPAAKTPEPAAPQPEKDMVPPPSTLVGFDLANWTLADQRFQEIFGKRTKSCLGLNLTQVVFSSGRLALALGAEYQRLSLDGQSTITKQATQLSLAPLSLGLRLIFRAGSLWPYASVGLAVYQYEEKSSLHNTTGTTAGFNLQGGIIVGTRSFQLLRAKVFVQWSKAVAKENGLEVNLGGMEIGAGLALAFSLF